MAFSNNLLHEVPMGQMRFMMGTFTNTSGSSGGDIRTGLHKVLQLKFCRQETLLNENSIHIRYVKM